MLRRKNNKNNKQLNKKKKRRLPRRNRKKLLQNIKDRKNNCLNNMSKNLMNKKSHKILIKIFLFKVLRTYLSRRRCLMSITYLIQEISSVVFFQLMFTPVSKNYKDLMYFTSVELMNMVPQHKSKPYNKKRHQDKFVTFIIKFMHLFINGLILDLIISVELLHNGILKFVKISF